MTQPGYERGQPSSEDMRKHCCHADVQMHMRAAHIQSLHCLNSLLFLTGSVECNVTFVRVNVFCLNYIAICLSSLVYS